MHSIITKEELCNIFDKSVYEDMTLAAKVFKNVEIKEAVCDKFYISHNILMNPIGVENYRIFKTNNPILLGYHKYELKTNIRIYDAFNIDIDKLIELHNPEFNDKIFETDFYELLKQKAMGDKVNLDCTFKLNFYFSVIYAEELKFVTESNPYAFIKNKYSNRLKNKIVISGFINYNTEYDKIISSKYGELDKSFSLVFSAILNSILHLNIPIFITMDNLNDYTKIVNEIAEHPFKVINYTTIGYSVNIINFFKKHYENYHYLEHIDFASSLSYTYIEKNNLTFIVKSIKIFDYIIRKFFTDFSGDRLIENLREFTSS